MPRNVAATRRFFAVKGAIAKRDAQSHIVFCGHRILVTQDNAHLVEFVREADAQAAYEAACMGTSHAPRLAA